MFNHSCSNNAIIYTSGDKMVVRAARSIARGEEVCINYLGRGSLLPVEMRQEALAEGYGFSCGCER